MAQVSVLEPVGALVLAWLLASLLVSAWALSSEPEPVWEYEWLLLRQASNFGRCPVYWLAARRKKKRYVYPGKASSVVPNMLRDEQTPVASEIVFSAIFEVQLADQTKVRGCFALRKRTRHILALAFDDSMRTDLVVSTIEMVAFFVPGMIWQSDQGRKSGAEQTRNVHLRKGFERSMSRAGTPTDNGYAERFVGQFKLSVAERRSYRTLGAFLRAAEDWINFYNQLRPHEGLDQQSPDHYASKHGLPTAPYLPLF
jgi:putative transposase